MNTENKTSLAPAAAASPALAPAPGSASDSTRLAWIATHVADVEWYPRDDGMHEQAILWWAYKTDDRMETKAVGATPLEALRLAIDTAMEHPANVPAPRAPQNTKLREPINE